ncbi:hypothetical protein D3C87_1783660 [compost metagenome]
MPGVTQGIGIGHQPQFQALLNLAQMQLPGAGKSVAFKQKSYQLTGTMMGKLWAGFGDHRPYPYIALHLSDVDIRQALHLHFDCTVTVEVPYLAVHAAAVP